MSFAAASAAKKLLHDLDNDLRGHTGGAGVVVSIPVSRKMLFLTGIDKALHKGTTFLNKYRGGPARVDQSAGDTICAFSSPGLADWGELVSLYSHPDHWGEGCGSIVIEEILQRFRETGYPG